MRILIVTAGSRGDVAPFTGLGQRLRQAGHQVALAAHGRFAELVRDRDLVLGAGEAAEFDTHVPHWFGSTGEGPAEVLSIFGRPGERMLVRATDGPAPPVDPHLDRP